MKVDSKNTIKRILQEVLEADVVKIEDHSAQHAKHPASIKSGAGHYAVCVVAKVFEGKNLLSRHQLIYDALRDQMGTIIHALSIRAQSPSEVGIKE